MKERIVKAAIMESAAGLFSSLGYEKTSVDLIARNAGKSKASVYYHYDSKLSIFRDVIKEEFRMLRKRLETVREEHRDDVAECLSCYLIARMEEMQKMAVYISAVRESFSHNMAAGDLEDTLKSEREEFYRWEARYFLSVGEMGLKTGVLNDRVYPEMFASMMVNLLKGLEIRFFLTSDSQSFRSTYEAIVELLIYRNPRLPAAGVTLSRCPQWKEEEN